MMIEITEGVVEDVFAPLCREYGLRVARISPREVLLVTHAYAIYFFTEPYEEDSIGIYYLDISEGSSGMMNYDLGLFLCAKRSAVSPRLETVVCTQEQELREGFQLILERFQAKAQDVLRGEKDWLRDYEPTWGTYPVEPRVETVIRRALEGAVTDQPEQPSAWVMQARLVAILLFIQGVSECAFGFLLIYQWVKSVLAIAIICLVFILGLLKIIAGIRNYQRRNRAMGILALAVAPLSVLTFFCVPSALVIMVYGLVVYLHPDVKKALLSGDRNI